MQIKLLRSLKDAGCDEAMMQSYLELQKEGKGQEQAKFLYIGSPFWIKLMSARI